MENKKEENNGNKKKRYPTISQSGAFIREIVVLDTKTFRKMYKLHNVSLDEAIARLSSLNDSKFRQSVGENYMKIKIDERILKLKKNCGMEVVIAFTEGRYHIPRGDWDMFNKAMRQALYKGENAFTFVKNRKKK